MNNLLNFTKRNRIAILVAIGGLLFLGLYLFFPKSKKEPLSPIGPSYNSLTPGESTKEQIIGKLGEPVGETKIGIYDVLQFDSPTTERPDEVYFEEGQTKLIKEIITYKSERKIENIKETYGNASLVLYGEDAPFGFYLFVYPEAGIAYIGNQNSGDLLEVWYFTPVASQEFIKNWGQGYSTAQPENPHEGDSVDF